MLFQTAISVLTKNFTRDWNAVQCTYDTRVLWKGIHECLVDSPGSSLVEIKSNWIKWWHFFTSTGTSFVQIIWLASFAKLPLNGVCADVYLCTTPGMPPLDNWCYFLLTSCLNRRYVKISRWRAGLVLSCNTVFAGTRVAAWHSVQHFLFLIAT